MLLTIAVFVLSAAYKSYTTPLWFDEFFTLFLSRLSSISELMKAIPADGQPPLQYLITHLSLVWLGESALSVRLPELLAYMAVGLLTYRIVRRHGTAIQALFALTCVMGAEVSAYQAYTARPYELLLAFTALVFFCWQVAASRCQSRILPLCGVAFGIAGAILSHHFGVVNIGVMLGAGEAARLIQRRRVDGMMLAAIATGLLPLAITIPLAEQSHRLLGEPILLSKIFWAKPSAADLLSYLGMFPVLLLFLTVPLVFVRWSEQPGADGSMSVNSVPAYEWAAVGALCMLVAVQLGIAAIATNYFQAKYAIGTALGLALLGGWGVPRIGRLRRGAQAALALGALYFLIVVTVQLVGGPVSHRAQAAQPGENAVSSLLPEAPGSLPIVVANAFDYAPDWWYSPPNLRKRLVYLSDPQYAVSQKDFLPELSLDLDKRYTPLPTSDYNSFVQSHSRFLLLRSGKDRLDWLPARLSSAGWHLKPIAKSGNNVLYQVVRRQ